ncbi:hypothetical protein JD844_026441 [Phrynosoma platyrhinos]|uniref:Uncharacterized protein n=1 Tax=Phrynosoma platyrhinos TaxID=52577 RepID=A0ABQ7SEV5_PHRPL|nr:hypothetical protein JD844_026441 [Phrynosoma platyrhinos]
MHAPHPSPQPIEVSTLSNEECPSSHFWVEKIEQKPTLCTISIAEMPQVSS